MVQGAKTGKTYEEKDIFNPAIYPRMKEEPLIDVNDCLVVPVRNKESPHFRRIGAPSFGKRVGVDERNPTHDKCVQNLLDELSSDKIQGVDFFTNVFADDRSYDEQIIFSTLPNGKYSWHKEADARIAFPDSTYIQPDLGGRDTTIFFQRATRPNILIEVIRTHHPDETTFFKLIELSKTNHHIYFYFIAEGKTSSVLNHYKVVDGRLKIRVSQYLLDGSVFKNGNPSPSKKKNETDSHWYQYLENSYFKPAKEKA